jgi:hypothetical protein
LEISESARRHDIIDADILHAWNNAVRYVEFEYDGEDRLLLSVPTPPDTCSNWWRCRWRSRPGSSTQTGFGQGSTTTCDEVMKMTMKVKRDDTGLDALDPKHTEARDAQHFRRIIAARKGMEDAEQELRDAVQAARDAGDSWTVIGAALDTTRQAAYQRFGQGR